MTGTTSQTQTFHVRNNEHGKYFDKVRSMCKDMGGRWDRDERVWIIDLDSDFTGHWIGATLVRYDVTVEEQS